MFLVWGTPVANSDQLSWLPHDCYWSAAHGWPGIMAEQNQDISIPLRTLFSLSPCQRRSGNGFPKPQHCFVYVERQNRSFTGALTGSSSSPLLSAQVQEAHWLLSCRSRIWLNSLVQNTNYSCIQLDTDAFEAFLKPQGFRSERFALQLAREKAF